MSWIPRTPEARLMNESYLWRSLSSLFKFAGFYGFMLQMEFKVCKNDRKANCFVFLSPLVISAYLCPQQNRKDEVQDMRRHEAISYTQFYSSTYFSPVVVTIWEGGLVFITIQCWMDTVKCFYVWIKRHLIQLLPHSLFACWWDSHCNKESVK